MSDIVIVAFITTFVGSLITYLATHGKNKSEEVKNKADALESYSAALTASQEREQKLLDRVEANGDRLTKLEVGQANSEAEKRELRSLLAATQAQLNAALLELESLRGKVSTLESGKTEDTSRNELLTKRVVELEAEVVSLEAKVRALETEKAAWISSGIIPS